MAAALLPTRWGVNSSAPAGGVLGGCSGHLFGFSGLDGDTHELTNFCGVFEASSVSPSSAFSVRFCGLDKPRSLFIIMPGTISEVTAATNDVLKISSSDPSPLPGGTSLSMAWAAGNLLAGFAPPDASVSLNESIPYSGSVAPAGVSCHVAGDNVAFCVSPTTMGMPWGLAYEDAGADAAVATAVTAACTHPFLMPPSARSPMAHVGMQASCQSTTPLSRSVRVQRGAQASR